MIVDSEVNSAEMVNILLEKDGFKTGVAYNKQQFREEIDSFQPDLILIADNIPGIIERYDEYFDENMPKTIVLTNERFTKREKKILSEKMNVVDYVRNPFDVDKLTSIVHRHLKKE